MKATAIAHPNIALIKYWGNRNSRLNLPANNSISMVMSGATTKTTVDFDKTYKDEITLNGQKLSGETKDRTTSHIRFIQKLAGDNSNFRIESENDFPTAAGIASSASGYAALTLATAGALELTLNERKLSAIARRGSGSACRSIHSGFVEWIASDKDEKSYAVQLAPPNKMNIIDLVVVTDLEKKKVSSAKGHKLAITSPFYEARMSGLKKTIPQMRKAIKSNNFSEVGALSEADCLSMHSVMLTSKPSLFYWSENTVKIIKRIADLRSKGIECYFTIDAGPNVHVLLQPRNEEEVLSELEAISGVKSIITNYPGDGARLSNKHLF